MEEDLEMKSLKTVTAAAFALAILLALPVQAEPLMTVVGFAQGEYSDRASSEIVVKITRVDQDPATENEQFTVDCTLNGGTAVENVDYRLAFNDSMQGLGKVVFPPGVREQAFSVHTLKAGATDKTLLIGLSNPSGPAPAVTGENPVAQITIVNQR
jgi:hypothetical protein